MYIFTHTPRDHKQYIHDAKEYILHIYLKERLQKSIKGIKQL